MLKMHTLLTLKRRWALLLYAALDVICAGFGMGVPIFCILLGLPVGWAIALRVTLRPRPLRQALGRVLRCSIPWPTWRTSASR
jgi:hypothetical protein